MLKVRVIPTLLWREHGLVKGVRFDSWRRTGTILPAVKVYNARDVDELIVVDITASRDGRAVDGDWVKGFAPYCFVPLTAGGGITFQGVNRAPNSTHNLGVCRGLLQLESLFVQGLQQFLRAFKEEFAQFGSPFF